MNRQDEIEAVIEKYKLWEDEGFMNSLPDEVDYEKEYNDMLNECYPTPEHMPNLKYSEYLAENDPVAYRCGFADYGDIMAENYFMRNNEEFYPVDGIIEAINGTLSELADEILNSQIIY